jgi:hypothetical protein
MRYRIREQTGVGSKYIIEYKNWYSMWWTPMNYADTLAEAKKVIYNDIHPVFTYDTKEDSFITKEPKGKP